jgi:two-component system OmpR family response regulator
MKILVVEDDQDVREYISKGLIEKGFAVDVCADGKEGLFLATTEPYNAIILDRMLPELDGLTVLKTLRGAQNQTPVLILSALSEVDDRVKGLKSGGDDYLVKPFAFSELLARVEILCRRSTKISPAIESVLKVQDLEMNLLSRKVTRQGKELPLQAREFSLLEYLLQNKGSVVTRTMLLEHVWDYHFDPQTNVIDVHISRLRQKIDKGFDVPLIKTIRGAGYIIE